MLPSAGRVSEWHFHPWISIGSLVFCHYFHGPPGMQVGDSARFTATFLDFRKFKGVFDRLESAEIIAMKQ